MLVDAHTHIDKYADELDEALRQIAEHRILTVCVGMDIPSYLQAKELAGRSQLLVPTFGIHPWEARHYCDDLEKLDPYLIETPMIGEAGLDFFWATETEYYPCQQKVFRYQCAWAQRLAKPMNLHTKGAEQEILQTLSEFRVRGSIIHWYSGPVELIEAYLALGCYFTLGVEMLTSASLQEIARHIPLERILLETDNPGGYAWLAGPVGMPVLLLDVLDKVAEVKGTGSSSLTAQLAKNWQEFSAGIKEFEHLA